MLKKVRQGIRYIMYYGLMRHLPASYGKLGVIWKCCRMFSAKLMLSRCGKNVNIEHGARFSPRCEVGDNSGIGVNAHLYGKVYIGDNVMMAPECTIYVRNHCFDNLSVPMNIQGSTDEKPVRIGSDVLIGGRVSFYQA